jgi:hypothetical protein
MKRKQIEENQRKKLQKPVFFTDVQTNLADEFQPDSAHLEISLT